MALGGVRGAEIVPGPVDAQIIRVIDGDTILVSARVWLGQHVEIRVRLAGIDTPELSSRCAAERGAALAAKTWLEHRVGVGSVQLYDITYGKYAGRVVARVVAPTGEDLAALLLQAGLGVAYDSGARRAWC